MNEPARFVSVTLSLPRTPNPLMSFVEKDLIGKKVVVRTCDLEDVCLGLDGKKGIARAFDSKNGHFVLELEDRTTFRVKGSSLQLVPEVIDVSIPDSKDDESESLEGIGTSISRHPKFSPLASLILHFPLPSLILLLPLSLSLSPPRTCMYSGGSGESDDESEVSAFAKAACRTCAGDGMWRAPAV